MSQPGGSPPPAMNTRFVPGLRSAFLTLAWAGWLAGAAAALGLFVSGVPVRFHQLRTLSVQAGRAVRGDPLGPLTTVLRAALSANAYPVIVLTQEILLVAGLTFVGILSGYLFPDGRFIPRWTRLLALCWLCWLLGGAIFPSLFLNFSRPYALDSTGLVALVIWLLTTLVAQEQRYRRASDQMQRQQTKWVLLCMTNTVVTYCVFMLPEALIPSLNMPGTPRLLYIVIGYPIFFLSLPVSPMIIFIAMVRRHLFDIDTVVNRALVYGTLTFALALIYAGCVLLLGVC